MTKGLCKWFLLKPHNSFYSKHICQSNIAYIKSNAKPYVFFVVIYEHKFTIIINFLQHIYLNAFKLQKKQCFTNKKSSLSTAW